MLTWQGCQAPLNDFNRINEEEPFRDPTERLKQLVSSENTKSFLAQNPDWWKKAESCYKLCIQKGYQITWPGEKSYPKPFLRFYEAPPVLTYIGSLPKKSDFSVTIVGSRKSAETALNWMDFFLPKVIKKYSLWIVSGGARGIDQKAHSIAILLKTPTVCFLPSGLDHIYPAQLNHLRNGILESGGAFVSCFPPGFRMHKAFFHIRNRLMACFSSLVLALQAEKRSGTMLTAQKALDCGLPVGTLPGSPLSPLWTGNLQLLYDGAFLLRDSLDLSILVENLKNQEFAGREDLPIAKRAANIF